MPLDQEQRRSLRRAGMSSRAFGYLSAVFSVKTEATTTAPGACTQADRGMPALSTSQDGDLACASALSVTPVGALSVVVNGSDQLLGVDCYFSGNGGITPRAAGGAVQGDTLHWRGSAAQFQLSPSDTISFIYEV